MRYILFLLALLVSSFSFAQDSESNDMENIEEVVTSALEGNTTRYWSCYYSDISFRH